jgi:hypothetical protein
MDERERELEGPAPELREFVERLAAEVTREQIEERRHPRHPRHRLMTEVWVQPVDKNFDPTAAAFMAMTRDISADGIGIVHNRAIRDRYLWLRLKTPSNQRMNVVVEVVRCRPVGNFYDIGGRFVAKLDEAPGFEMPES